MEAKTVSVHPAEDARELIRFLLSSVGHPVVLDRDDCALLAAQVERGLLMDEIAQAAETHTKQSEPAPLAS
jgi:hypothetical protein